MEFLLVPLIAALWLTAVILRVAPDDTLWSFLESLGAGFLWLVLFFITQWLAAARNFKLGDEQAAAWLLVSAASAGCVITSAAKLIELKRRRRRVGRMR